jgi:hypothetical protein
MALQGTVRALAAPVPLIARGVKASDGTYGDRVDVTWSAADGATSYELWRATNSAMTVATRVSTGTATNQSDTSAIPGIVYYYRVKSVNSNGISAYSASDSGYRLAPPAAPNAPAASDGTSASYVYVTWSGVSGATGYELWRGVSSDVGTASNVTATSQYTTSYYDYGAPQGSLCYYWVRATNAAGASAYSPYDTGYRTLSAPTGVAATDGTHVDKVAVSWTAAIGATGYEIWRHTTSSSASAALIGTSGNVTHDDYSAVPGTTYYYWVKATNSFSTSGFSSYNTGYRTSLPEMDVQGNGVSIADGDGTPSPADHTDFGSALVSGGSVTRTYTVRNTGAATLNLTGSPRVVVGGTHAADFTVAAQPAASVTAGGTTTFQVTFAPSASGTRSATLSIASNDTDKNPYNFSIRGEGITPPEIQALEMKPGGDVVIRWTSSANYRYTVRHSTNLVNGFSVLQGNIQGTPPMNSYTDNVNGVMMKFWKVTLDE